MAVATAMASMTVPVPANHQHQGFASISPNSASSPALTFSRTAPLFLSSSGRCSLSRQVCELLPRNKPCRVFCSQVKLKDDIDDETCELVSGTELILGNDTDGFRAYLLKAVKNNNGSGVLVLSDVYGFEASSTRDFAYRVACNGYNVLVPDIFRGNPWTRGRDRSEFDDWVAKQPPERVVKDVKISARWMLDELLAAGISEKLGIIGFCFGGGRLMDTLAEDMGAQFSTAVCFYGTHMDPSRSADIKIPVLFISGDSDPLCPTEIVHDFEKRIGRGSRVIVFKGQGHAFVHRPESPEADKDAEEAFSIMRNWLHDGLVVGEGEAKREQEATMGVEKQVLRPGNGPQAARGQNVTVHCTGYGKNGDLGQKFWSTKDPGQQPFTFKIGQGEVIKGWDEGVMGMRVGEVARLYCTPDYAYGPNGFLAWGIQPNSALIFEIEVLSAQ